MALPEGTNTPTVFTSRALLALRAGARLFVTLANGREIEATLLARPTIVGSGTPGVRRVRLQVRDEEAAASAARRPERRASYSRSPFAPRDTTLHSVRGDQVRDVLGTCPRCGCAMQCGDELPEERCCDACARK